MKDEAPKCWGPRFVYAKVRLPVEGFQRGCYNQERSARVRYCRCILWFATPHQSSVKRTILAARDPNVGFENVAR